MKPEELKAAFINFFEETYNNKGNLDAVDDLFAEGLIYHLPPIGDYKGIEAYKKYIVDHRSGYPDLQIMIDDFVAEGDISAMRWRIRGTNTGHSPTLGTPPTGKNVSFTGCTVFHHVGKKVVEMWTYADYVGLMKQLGYQIVPPQK